MFCRSLQALKQVHPEKSISKKTMLVLDSFVLDVMDKIATEASNVVRMNKKSTLTARDIQTAVRLVLPGELAQRAVSEAFLACTAGTWKKQ